MNYQYWQKRLNLLILVALFILLMMITAYGINPCADCSFEIGGEDLNIKEFFGLFTEMCLIVKENVGLEGILNISNGKS